MTYRPGRDGLFKTMKKIYIFLRSMTFGLILLGLTAAVSVLGSIIPQNQSAMTYVRGYPSLYPWIFRLQLDHVFTSWYFILLIILLCINLTLCSIIRFHGIRQEDILKRAAGAEASVKLSHEGITRIRTELERMHMHKNVQDGRIIYHKNLPGRYGTFITHLGILFTVIFFALGMVIPKILDESCYPDEAVTLEDGTRIEVKDFHITDEEGKLDYRSVINVILPSGKETGDRELEVNHPVKAGSYKIYQQTYGTVGQISVRDTKGHEDVFYIESQDFLSADGKTGILIDNLYPGLKETENGTELITSTMGRYEDPVYIFMVMENGSTESMLAFPGDTLDVGGYTYTFLDPVEYPGLRIKYSPAWVSWALLAAVLVLTFGLAVTFLFVPAVVTVTDQGYRVMTPKAEGLILRLQAVTADNGNTEVDENA